MRGRQKTLFCQYFFFVGALIIIEWKVVGWGRRSSSGLPEIAFFSRQDFNRSDKHDIFWQVVSTGTGYFYVLFLWPIVVSDFCLLEICKDLGHPCQLSLLHSTAMQITISVNIFVSNIQYEISFLLKYTLRFFIYKFEIKCEAPHLFFQIKTMTYRKKHFIEKIWKKYWITCCRHMTSHAIWIDEITRVVISIKKFNKN